MPKLVLDVDWRLLARQEERGVGVAQVMEAPPPEPRLLEKRIPEPVQQVHGVEWAPSLAGEYPLDEIVALEGRLGLQKGFPSRTPTSEDVGHVHPPCAAA